MRGFRLFLLLIVGCCFAQTVPFAFWSAGSPTIYVDSNAADDTADGRSSATPKKTLAAAQTLATNIVPARVALKRGSSWREQFNIPANNVTITVYGSGAMPIIDGADLAGTWTQPDAGTYPNVWSQSWVRTSASTTASEYLGYWEDGARPARYASDATTDLQANGGWFSSNLTAQTSTVSIKSAANPNSDGIVRELTRRHYGISGHNNNLGVTRIGQVVTGPIEIKRCVGHYNAYAGGVGPGASRLFLRDGNVHHSVTEGLLTEDSLATEYSPQISPSVFVSYSADGSLFDHTFRRCLALLPGGASRIANIAASAFYGHSSSSPPNMRNQTLEGCISRGATFGGPSANGTFTVSGGYCEDAYGIFLGATALTANTINYFIARDTAAPSPNPSSHVALRDITTGVPMTVQHFASYTMFNSVVQVAGDAGAVAITNSALVSSTAGPVTGVFGNRGTPAINKCIIWGSRSYDELTTGYTGDYNVFYFIGQSAPQFGYAGSTHNTLSAFQSASGQDANSVFLKSIDQTASNANAFWLGVSSGANNGPVDGDFRINPSAKVYKGDGSSLTGLFGDGATLITTAGPQFYYNFNTRAVTAGPPTRYPTLPTTVTESRAYVDSPTAWNFYP